MERPPRPRSEGVIRRAMLVRAWLFLGLISAAARAWPASSTCCCAPAGAPATATGTGTPLHHAYLQATTMTFLGIVACQIGTAFAARTERASLRSVGVFTNRLLLWGIAFELVVRRRVVYLPPLQRLFGDGAAAPTRLLLLAAVPVHRLGRRRAVAGETAESSDMRSVGRSSVAEHRFGSSDPFTLGIEEEYMLLIEKASTSSSARTRSSTPISMASWQRGPPARSFSRRSRGRLRSAPPFRTWPPSSGSCALTWPTSSRATGSCSRQRGRIRLRATRIRSSPSRDQDHRGIVERLQLPGSSAS